jgi:hypothetical protein
VKIIPDAPSFSANSPADIFDSFFDCKTGITQRRESSIVQAGGGKDFDAAHNFSVVSCQQSAVNGKTL